MLIVSDIERGIELLPANILWENVLEKYVENQKEIDNSNNYCYYNDNKNNY